MQSDEKSDDNKASELVVGRVHLTDRMSYFDRIADFALHEHERITPEQLQRQVVLALKEVERDTRHKAAELAGALHREIMNMTPNAKLENRLGTQPKG